MRGFLFRALGLNRVQGLGFRVLCLDRIKVKVCWSSPFKNGCHTLWSILGSAYFWKLPMGSFHEGIRNPKPQALKSTPRISFSPCARAITGSVF